MPGILTRKPHLLPLVAASLGAVVGFALVWSSLLGVELAAPVALLPAIKRDWKATWVNRQLLSEISVYLAACGCLAEDGHTARRSRLDRLRTFTYAQWIRIRYRAPACAPAVVPFVAAYHRRLQAMPPLTRHQSLTLDRVSRKTAGRSQVYRDKAA